MSGVPIKRAELRHGWWPGWIWAIPIAALLLVAWLAFRSLSSSGPEVTVVFPVIADLQASNTAVTFEGLKVGQVSSVKLEADYRHMRAQLSLDADMDGHLGKGTQFWIIGRSPSLSHLSDVKALISGVSIGIKPAPGPTQKEYTGLAQDPVLEFGAEGTAVTLRADKLGSVQAGTPIYYLGEQVGVVQSYRMTGTRTFEISAFINTPYDRLVHDGTRFWRAGPVHISSGGNGPSVQFQSVPALFQGAIAFETPGGAVAGPVASAGHAFSLYDDEDAARNAPDAQGVPYRVVFDAAEGVPDMNAPVTLMGKRVGSVERSALEYDPDRQKLLVVATIALEPRNIDLAAGKTWSDPRAQMDAMVSALVAQGLRASLTSSPPVIGGEQVALRIVPGDPATMVFGGALPEIPTTAGGGVSGVIAQVNDVTAKLDALPIGQIADNLKQVSAHVARLTSSPELAATLQHVDGATADLERVSEQMRRELPSTLTSLRAAIADARTSLASTQTLLSARGPSASAPESADLPQTLYEISRAARALRELSDLLDRNPSAVLTGR